MTKMTCCRRQIAWMAATVALLQSAFTISVVHGSIFKVETFGKKFHTAAEPEERDLRGLNIYSDDPHAYQKRSTKLVVEEETAKYAIHSRSGAFHVNRRRRHLSALPKAGKSASSAVRRRRLHSSAQEISESVLTHPFHPSFDSDSQKKRPKRRQLQNSAARSACEADAAVVEALPDISFNCTCAVDAGTGYRLQCESSCGEFCNAERTSCGVKTLSRVYDSTGLNTVQSEGFLYQRGERRGSSVDVRQLGCAEDGTCTECIGVVGGNKACNSCTLQACSDGSLAPLLNCENIEGGATLDFCASELSVEEGDLEYLSSGEFTECIDPLEVPMSVCETDKVFFEAVPDKMYICECQQHDDDTVILNCKTACGDFCNNDLTVCGTESHDQLYDLAGNPYLVADNFFYSIGLPNERLAVVKNGCSRNEGASVDDITCESCSVRISQFDRCDDCALQTCSSDGKQVPIANCLGISGGDFFDFCEPESIQVYEGVFQYWNADEFSTCLDRSPTNDLCHDNGPTVLANGTVTTGSTEFAVDDGEIKCDPGSFSPGLWYNFVGSGVGIEASTCGPGTDFDTSISIFSGACGELDCVTSNDDAPPVGDCDFGHSTVSWFAEEGVTYRIRVQGFGTARGQFQLTLSEVNLAEAACLANVEKIENTAPSISGATCGCESTDNITQTMRCRDTCKYCNGEGTVCASRTFGGSFNNEETRFSKFEEHQYTTGRADVLRITQTNCTSSNGCESCSVTVDGQQCTSCSFVDCVDEFGVVDGSGLQIDCSNLEANATFSECDGGVAPGVFQALNAQDFGKCIQEPIEACESMAARREKEFADVGTRCSCESLSNRAILTCEETACQYCNTDTSICANTSYGIAITGTEGEIASTFVEHKYIEGRDEVLRYEMTGNFCVFTIDGTECNSCNVVTCTDLFGSFDGIVVDCENVEAGAVYSECDPPSDIEGIFEIFSHEEFETCFGNETANQACLDAKLEHENNGAELEYGTTCECTVNAITGDHTLSCTDAGCLWCNYPGTVCATNGFGTRYGRFGQEMGSFTRYTYIEAEGGRTERVDLETFDGECSLSVDDQQCSSCEVVECGNAVFPFDKYQVNCTNVPDGGSFGSGCDPAFVDTGVLEVATDFEFHTCIKARSPAEVCREALFDKEAAGFVCECKDNEYGGQQLYCVDEKCLHCNEEGTVCGFEIRGVIFGDKGQELGSFQGFKYIEGRDDTLLFGIIKDPADPRDCYVSANGMECEGCIVNDCLGPAIQAQCENIDGGTNFDECTLDPVEDGVFEYFAPLEFEECVKVQDPLEFCEDQKKFIEVSQGDLGTQCDCSPEGEGVKLACFDLTCKFCNADESVCKLNADYGGMIGKYGFFTTSFDTSVFISGRNERIMIEKGPGDLCEVFMNGKVCSSCSVALCPGGSTALDIDCGNVIANATHAGCDGTGSEVLQFVSDENFSLCKAYDGTFPPTAAPTTPPTDDSDTLAGTGSSAAAIRLGLVVFSILQLLTYYFF